jgi:hypothetical protein
MALLRVAVWVSVVVAVALLCWGWFRLIVFVLDEWREARVDRAIRRELAEMQQEAQDRRRRAGLNAITQERR